MLGEWQCREISGLLALLRWMVATGDTAAPAVSSLEGSFVFALPLTHSFFCLVSRCLIDLRLMFVEPFSRAVVFAQGTHSRYAAS